MVRAELGDSGVEAVCPHTQSAWKNSVSNSTTQERIKRFSRSFALMALAGDAAITSSSPNGSRRWAYMPDPAAFRQSVARVVGTRMKDATQGAAFGNNPGKPVLRSMRNGAGVGAVQGGATGFVGGEILGGEVTGGGTGISGAAPGGFVGGHVGAGEGRFIHWRFFQGRGRPA